MNSFYIGLLAGIFLGALLGMVLTCLLQISREEKWWKEEINEKTRQQEQYNLKEVK